MTSDLHTQAIFKLVPIATVLNSQIFFKHFSRCAVFTFATIPLFRRLASLTDCTIHIFRNSPYSPASPELVSFAPGVFFKCFCSGSRRTAFLSLFSPSKTPLRDHFALFSGYSITSFAQVRPSCVHPIREEHFCAFLSSCAT